MTSTDHFDTALVTYRRRCRVDDGRRPRGGEPDEGGDGEGSGESERVGGRGQRQLNRRRRRPLDRQEQEEATRHTR